MTGELASELTADTKDYEDGMKRSAEATEKLKDKQEETSKSTDKMADATKKTATENIRLNMIFGDVISTLTDVGQSANQTNAMLKNLGLTNAELTSGQKSFAAWTQYASAQTIPVMRGIQFESQMVGTKAEGMGLAFGGVMSAMDAVNISMAAFNAQSPEQQRNLSLLAALDWGLAAAEFGVALAKTAATHPGPAGIVLMGIEAAAFGVALGMAAGMLANAAMTSAETSPGGPANVVDQTGMAVIHKDERIYTPSSRGGDTYGGNTYVLNYNGSGAPQDVERAMKRAVRGQARRSGVHRSDTR